MKSVVGVIQNLQKFGPSRRGPLTKFCTLAIAGHGGPPINLFVIPTLISTPVKFTRYPVTNALTDNFDFQSNFSSDKPFEIGYLGKYEIIRT